jgi:glucose/arabinose dehydrogenase
VGLGDDQESCAAADSTSLRGQILRLRVADLPPGGGGPVARADLTPPDNPLSTADSNAALVWAYGLRNPWRFHLDPTSGLLYVADPGESSFEEYDEVRPGDRLGWPYREGQLVVPRILCPEPGGAGASPYVAPIAIVEDPPSDPTAISAAGPYRPPGGAYDWPAEYHGNVFFGDYYRGFLRRLVFDGDSWDPAPVETGQPDTTDRATGLAHAVDFLVGPDGSLWWLSQFDDAFDPQTGSLQRIRWVGPLAAPDRGPRHRPRLAARPVPSAADIELSFTLAADGDVTLAIYDLGGRRVRTLMKDRSVAGPVRATWDGRDATGLPVAPGLYLARLVTREGVVTARILRLR